VAHRALTALETADPARVLLLAAALRLAEEADGAAHWGGATPLLDFVLGRSKASQPELESAELDAAELDAAELDAVDDEDTREEKEIREEGGTADAPVPAPVDDVPSVDSTHAMDSAEVMA
jgi:hypothetical protein